ncbi:hypothetical protein [Pararobbsia silviterrae]|uniref:Preprotein translocase subunit SecD n=1 Tax=Pararobbsia silviterrae TaxID=1792498 RepID=A0A494X649_9BURK|nr:hypothetical protein [Pararobbsia silviterrae]RKP46167.1 hypothetical protein D7S86_24920 [Pararobbsia silviterrae]
MRASDFLPDHVNQGDINGTTVRKGTVGAFLVNARVWSDPHASADAKAQAQADIVEALPALRAIGLFDVLEVRDAGLRAWIQNRI